MDTKLALLRLTAMINVAIVAVGGTLGCTSNRGSGGLELAGDRLRAIGDERMERLDQDRADRAARDRLFSVVSDGATEQDTPPSPWFERVATLSDFGDESLNDTPPVVRGPRRAPLPGFWATVQRDLRDLPPVFWQDTKKVFTNRTNLLILGTTYGASLALQETGPDDTVEDSFRTHTTFKKDFRGGLAAIGNPGMHFGLAGIWYVIGQQTQNEKTYDVSTKLFRALAVTGASTLLGQAATWDRSPNGDWGTFPSGHASSSFAFASVLHREYGPGVGIPLYALSALVGWSRLEDGEHYLSDVVMGGIMGLVMGHTIANDGEPLRLFGGEIQPFVDPIVGAGGLAWVTHFK